MSDSYLEESFDQFYDQRSDPSAAAEQAPDLDEADKVPRLFPVDPANMGVHARWFIKKNAPHVARWKPGDIGYHTPNVQPARYQPWPDATSIDQQRNRELSVPGQWGFLAPPKSVVMVVGGPWYDNLGNAWFYVLVNGRHGYLNMAHLVSEEQFKKMAPTYREYLDHGW